MREKELEGRIRAGIYIRRHCQTADDLKWREREQEEEGGGRGEREKKIDRD